MHASIRRDLALIVALGLLLYGLVEFRASTTSPILQYAQGRKSSSSFVHTSGDTAEAREGYEDVRAMGSYPALNPSALHYHKSSSSSPKPKHRHIGKAVSKLSSKEQQRLRLMRRFPITELVKHAPGTMTRRHHARPVNMLSSSWLSRLHNPRQCLPLQRDAVHRSGGHVPKHVPGTTDDDLQRRRSGR